MKAVKTQSDKKVERMQAQPGPNGYKISSSCDAGACVGVKKLNNGAIAVINTTSVAKKPVVFTKEEWVAFTAGVKNGEFDTDNL